MKFRHLIFAATFVASLLPPALSRADEDVVSVTKNGDTRDMGNGYVDSIFVVTITSRVEEISISAVLFNRRNCGLSYHNLVSYPIKLKFGQQLRLEPDCDVIEATVSTDKGDFKFDWDQ